MLSFFFQSYVVRLVARESVKVHILVLFQRL